MANNTIELALRFFLSQQTPLIDVMDKNQFIEKVPQKVVQNSPTIVINKEEQENYNTVDGSVSMRSASIDLEVRATNGPLAIRIRDALIVLLQNYTGAMGDLFISAVLNLGDFNDYEYTQDGSEVGHFVSTLSLQIQYTV